MRTYIVMHTYSKVPILTRETKTFKTRKYAEMHANKMNEGIWREKENYGETEHYWVKEIINEKDIDNNR